MRFTPTDTGVFNCEHCKLCFPHGYLYMYLAISTYRRFIIWVLLFCFTSEKIETSQSARTADTTKSAHTFHYFLFHSMISMFYPYPFSVSVPHWRWTCLDSLVFPMCLSFPFPGLAKVLHRGRFGDGRNQLCTTLQRHQLWQGGSNGF